mgnify:CR=1 FL=1
MTDNNLSPKEQTAEVCDEIRAELGFAKKGVHTLTQTEKREILSELCD